MKSSRQFLPTENPEAPLGKGGIKCDYSTCNMSSSLFGKGGSRGILLRLCLPENHRSIFTPRGKLNCAIPSIDVMGFELLDYFSRFPLPFVVRIVGSWKNLNFARASNP